MLRQGTITLVAGGAGEPIADLRAKSPDAPLHIVFSGRGSVVGPSPRRVHWSGPPALHD